MEYVTMPAVQVLLLAIVFLALFVEIKTGGLGAGVLLGLVAAGVFFGSQYIKGMVSLYQIGIFLAGIFFIVVEILMPTVGLLAAVGVAAMLYSIVLAMGGDINAVYAMLASFVLAILLFAFLVKRLPSSRLWKKFVLSDQSTSQRGYVSSESKAELVGKQGRVLTELRPAGSILIEGAPVDVVSEGAFIDKDEMVEVVAVHGSRVVVRRVAV